MLSRQNLKSLPLTSVALQKTAVKCLIINSPYLRLCEDESQDLAIGIRDMDFKFFPFKEAGVEVASYSKPIGPSADHMGASQERRQLIRNTRYNRPEFTKNLPKINDL